MKQPNPNPKRSSTKMAAALRRSVLRLARRLRAASPEGGMTLARLSVLRWLHQHGAMTAGQIAAADSLQPQSVTRLLAALESDGLIARRSDEGDRRRALVTITEAGVKALRADVAYRDTWLEEAIKSRLNERERAILAEASALLDLLADDDKASISVD